MGNTEFAQSLRRKQEEQQKEAELPTNIRQVDVAVESMKNYLKRFTDNKENCFCQFIQLRWRRFLNQDEACYDVYDVNHPKDVICMFPKIMLHEFERKLSDLGVVSSASICDDGHINLTW